MTLSGFLQSRLRRAFSSRLGASPRKAGDALLYPCPPDGAAVGANPPGFAWHPVRHARTYRLEIRAADGGLIYESPAASDPVHVPSRTFPSGEYLWDVEAFDERERSMTRRGFWRFSIPSGLPELPWRDPAAILAAVPGPHPRYVFPSPELENLRRSLTGSRSLEWRAIQEMAGRAMELPMPRPPRYHTHYGRRRRQMGYGAFTREFRQRVDAALTVLPLAYLAGGDERFGLRAKELLLELESWGPGGPMSLLSEHGDEPGLSLARHCHRAYDWLYPLFNPSERDRIREMVAARARQTRERLQRHDYLSTPGESHDGRLIAYLAEYAIVLKDEAPECVEWLDYSLRALMTFYPHWGDADGGWAEGVTYAISYNSVYLPALEALRAAGLDLYQRPFFGNIRKFLLYCASPIGEMRPFGDGADRGAPGAPAAMLMKHYSRRFQDPVCAGWARETGTSGIADPLIALAGGEDIAASAPTELPSARCFSGVGWAAMHSHLHDPRRDTFLLFKSSPFGSVSHSHADQNSFAILKGGRALAIPSGYYGPGYAMPHHARWTRQSKANNTVLVNGHGQLVQDRDARGRICSFRHQRVLTYVSGEAAGAYGGLLKRFRRHILFVRPGVFLLLDELEAPRAAKFQWLLHSLDEMDIDAAVGALTCRRQDATLAVKLHGSCQFRFEKTNRFEPPYNTGAPREFRREMANHWHCTASTIRPMISARIGAVMVVRDSRDEFETEVREAAGGLSVSIRTLDGEGEAWVETSPGAGGPLGPAALAARWRPARGECEELAVDIETAGAG